MIVNITNAIINGISSIITDVNIWTKKLYSSLNLMYCKIFVADPTIIIIYIILSPSFKRPNPSIYFK